MVAPRLPSHSDSRKRRRKPRTTNNVDNRVLLVLPCLASLAILWNIVRLCRILVRPNGRGASVFHREHAAVASWNFHDWCSSDSKNRFCLYFLPLDLQDYLPPDPDEPFLEFVPDAEFLGDLFETDDESGSKSDKETASNRTMTDDLDNHIDRLGNLLMNPGKLLFPPTPRILVEARRNISLSQFTAPRAITRENQNQSNTIQHPIAPSLIGGDNKKNNVFALLSRRGLGGSHFYNQDRAVLIDPYPVLRTRKQKRKNKMDGPEDNNFFLGVFDGHGLSGHVKADFAATVLPNLLMERLSTFDDKQYTDSQIRKAFQSAFWEAHRQGPLIHDSGCTASIIVRLRQRLYFANTGDSRSFLIQIHVDKDSNGNSNVNITHTTRQHKPDDPMERRRIVSAGCVVIDPIPFQDPSARVVESIDAPGPRLALAMSRSLGDYDLEHCAVIPEPTITLVDLAKQPSHKGVILLAVTVTDGMFDYVSLEEIAQALSVPYLTTNSYLAREASPLELAAEDLIRTASDRWVMNNTLSPYRDDITIAVRRVR